MQKISIDAALPGMTIAKNVFNADGQLLLAAGQTVTSTQIKRLMGAGVASIYIDNQYGRDIETPEIIREETRVKAIQTVKAALMNLQYRSTMDISSCQRLVNLIIDEILSNAQVMIHLTDIRTHDDYTFGHSVNVCLLSLMIGRLIGYSEARLRELGLGALLHDVGKMMIPLEILNKPGKLSDQEWLVMRCHSDYGFEILRKQELDVPLLAAHVAYQHHEQYNGCGYPRGIGGQDIQEYARITAIADSYDALTSARPYRKAMLPHEAYEILMAETDNHFDRTYLKVFLSHVAVYPVGVMVRLTTGEIGIVERVIPGLQARPLVRVVIDACGQPVTELCRIDLSQKLSVFVEAVLTDTELAEFYRH